MPYKAIIFDLDGTLLDTLEDIADSMNLALGENGLPEHPLDAYRYFVGSGVKVLAELSVGKGSTPELVQKVLEGYLWHYARLSKNKTRPYDGVTDAAKALHYKGLKLAVLSNKPHLSTLEVVAEYFPDLPFTAVYGQREGVPHKPDPGATLAIAREMGIDPADFLYAGDTAVDMRTASGAGMYAVGVLWGFRYIEELVESGARVIISRPDELPKLV